MKRKDFSFKREWLGMIMDCPKEVQDELLRAIPLYALEGVEIPLSEKASSVFVTIAKQLSSKFDFDIDPRFAEIFCDWIEYKKRKGKGYKNQTSMQTCYKNMLKKSFNDPSIARVMIDEAIGNNYEGFFTPRQFYGREYRASNHQTEFTSRIGEKLGWASGS